MSYDAEIVQSFLDDEVAEYLPQMRQYLLRLEAKPKDKEALEECYRLAHTIKGSGAMLDLQDISQEGQAIERTLLPIMEKSRLMTPLCLKLY